MKVLSIIVPAYNSQQYLHKVIPSLLQNDVLDELDIVIVDDGSTDNTAAVAERYCTKYPSSVRLIRQANKGHGGALNTGCMAAVGKYLKIIDADDWVETENLPELIRQLSCCESDVVLTHYYTRNVSTGETRKWMVYPPEFGKSYSLNDILHRWGDFNRGLTLHGIAYNTGFYQKCGFQLSEHVFYEDYEFASIPCCDAKTITPLNLFLYNYRIGDTAQSVSDESQLKRIEHTRTVLHRLTEESVARMTTPDGRIYLCYKIQELLLSFLTTVLLVEPNRQEGRKQAAEIMNYFKKNQPHVYNLALKKYGAFYAMNILHMRKHHWETLRDSQLYAWLMHKHDFN